MSEREYTIEDLARAWDEGFLAADITATGYPDNPYKGVGDE